MLLTDTHIPHLLAQLASSEPLQPLHQLLVLRSHLNTHVYAGPFIPPASAIACILSVTAVRIVHTLGQFPFDEARQRMKGIARRRFWPSARPPRDPSHDPLPSDRASTCWVDDVH